MDESGITLNLRLGNRSCCRVMDLYDDWRKTIALEWRSGAIIEMQCKGSDLLLVLEDGAVMTVKLHRERGRRR
jgi:hypothetical protein